MLRNKSRLEYVKNILRFITALYFIWIIFGGNIGQLYMLWNLILAWVPLEIATLIGIINSKHRQKELFKIITIGLWVLWLIFYPNAPYMVTDFIHISPNEYYITNPNYIPYSNLPKTLFSDDLTIWVDLINIAIGVWIGYTVGFISLYLNQDILSKKYNKLISWVFVLVVQLLSGFAIYIGRFGRWNSWDIIFNPSNIGMIVSNSIHIKAIYFTILFGIFNLVIYLINFSLVRLVKKE